MQFCVILELILCSVQNMQASFGKRADLIIAADTVVELNVISIPLLPVFRLRLVYKLEIIQNCILNCDLVWGRCSAGPSTGETT